MSSKILGDICFMLYFISQVYNRCPLLDENGNVIHKENISNEELDIYAERWKETLLHMDFLANEMYEDTCSIKNPFEKKYNRIHKTFTRKYGFWGEKLYTEQDKKKKEDGFKDAALK